MKCPHCHTGIKVEFDDSVSEAYQAKDYEETGMGYQFAWNHCPQCKEPVVFLWRGKFVTRKRPDTDYGWSDLESIEEEEILYPKYIARKVEPEVPSKYKSEFLEACSVLPQSPKASAALSRRILQNILRGEFSIKHSSLAKEIEDFIQLNGVPSYLTEAVDAIRNVGNFAAHPLKDTSTGQIVDVEQGEAEWLLEVLEALFDL